MYEEFYGFVQSPFTLAADPQFFYPAGSHSEALRLLQQSIHRKEGFIVLTADIGVGKTTLCRTLVEQLDQTTFTSLVLNPFLSVEELLREILLDFGVVSRQAVRGGRIGAASAPELRGALDGFLRSLAPLRGSGVLIIDEAQHLSPQVLEEIRLISNLETERGKLLQVVLVGQRNLLDLLAPSETGHVDQRISLKATLEPLTRDEVAPYVAHRLAIARASSPVSFDAAAIALVHSLSGGVPRVINLVCDRALMVGARSGLRTITAAAVRDASRALQLGSAPARWWQRVPRWAYVLAGLLLLTAAALLFTPFDRVIDPGTPAAPPQPPQPLAAPAIRPPDVPADIVPRPGGAIRRLQPL
jgi:general secretion pathway protein A